MVLPITPLTSSSASAFRCSAPSASTVKHNFLSENYFLFSATRLILSQSTDYVPLTQPLCFPSSCLAWSNGSFALSRLPGLPSRGTEFLSPSHTLIFLKASTSCGNLYSCQLSSSLTRSDLMPGSLSRVSLTYPLISFSLPMDSKVWILVTSFS